MKICIIGGGNIGTAMAITAASFGQAEVSMLTSKPKKWCLKLSMIDPISNEYTEGTLVAATSDYAQALESCDMVLIAQPSFMVADTLKKLNLYLKSPVMVGVIPGTGGVEYAAGGLLKNGHTLFGVDRVPCIARLKQYGKSVESTPKKSIRLCAIPGGQTTYICELFSRLFKVECHPVKNYLTITLTPSNPILHTVRLFSLFHNYLQTEWITNPMFYSDWDDAASELLLACDRELITLCSTLSDIPIEVIPLSVHYEANTVKDMTKKLRSLTALKNIRSPMLLSNGKCILDLSSRYFTEDFPYGLCIIKGFASVCGVSVPNMDLILRWYEQLTGVQYFNNNAFSGADLRNTGIPQNYGIHTFSDVYHFYTDILK